jgi:hypothetical protein
VNDQNDRPVEPIMRVQPLHLDLVRCISFNDFYGALVADGQIVHRDRWVGVISAHSYRLHPALGLFSELPKMPGTRTRSGSWLLIGKQASSFANCAVNSGLQTKRGFIHRKKPNSFCKPR